MKRLRDDLLVELSGEGRRMELVGEDGEEMEMKASDRWQIRKGN